MSPASSADTREDEVPPVGSPHITSQSLVDLPVTSNPETRPEENIESSKGNVMKRWLQTRLKKSTKEPEPHKYDRLSGKSRETADHQSLPHPPSRVDDTHERHSRMAAGRRKAVSAL